MPLFIDRALPPAIVLSITLVLFVALRLRKENLLSRPCPVHPLSLLAVPFHLEQMTRWYHSFHCLKQPYRLYTLHLILLRKCTSDMPRLPPFVY
jgi:hypothetical protein